MERMAKKADLSPTQGDEVLHFVLAAQASETSKLGAGQ
jgi:hypothetical protein